jgi:hypothetical protein
MMNLRSRLRFSLRVLLTVLTLTCVALGVWSHRATQQKRLIGLIKSRGGEVKYGFEAQYRLASTGTGRSSVPRWLLEHLGEDYFHDVTFVLLRDPALLSELARFGRLESLMIADSRLNDVSSAPIARLKTLKALSIYPQGDNPAVTDIGNGSLDMFAKLPALETVNAFGSQITTTGLESLAHSKSLRHISIVSYDASINDQAAEPFRRTGRATGTIQRWSPGSGGAVLSKFRAR